MRASGLSGMSRCLLVEGRRLSGRRLLYRGVGEQVACAWSLAHAGLDWPLQVSPLKYPVSFSKRGFSVFGMFLFVSENLFSL